ncbi:MAG: hypothetical protein B7X12_06580 [Halothiobacillus sp. 20-53-49]|nr:MAG: hypothetical protein B7X12_06580 [Halothiobacillus sp. 20-53-49]
MCTLGRSGVWEGLHAQVRRSRGRGKSKITPYHADNAVGLHQDASCAKEFCFNTVQARAVKNHNQLFLLIFIHGTHSAL